MISILESQATKSIFLHHHDRGDSGKTVKLGRIRHWRNTKGLGEMCISQIIERRFLVRGDKWLWHHLRVIFPKILPRSKGHFSPAYAPSAAEHKNRSWPKRKYFTSLGRAGGERKTHTPVSLCNIVF
jgi:hypothetical protein